jgi:hypothetical protein
VVSEGGSEWCVAVDEWFGDLVDERDRMLCRQTIAGDQVIIQDDHV